MENVPRKSETVFFTFGLLSTLFSMIAIIAVVTCELYTHNMRIVPVTFYTGYWTSPFILFTAMSYLIVKCRRDGKCYKLAIFFPLVTLIVCILGIMFSLFTIYWIVEIIDAQVYYEYREEIVVQTSFLVLACGLCLMNAFSLTCCCFNASSVSNERIVDQHNLKTHSIDNLQSPVQNNNTNHI